MHAQACAESIAIISGIWTVENHIFIEFELQWAHNFWNGCQIWLNDVVSVGFVSSVLCYI